MFSTWHQEITLEKNREATSTAACFEICRLICHINLYGKEFINSVFVKIILIIDSLPYSFEWGIIGNRSFSPRHWKSPKTARRNLFEYLGINRRSAYFVLCFSYCLVPPYSFRSYFASICISLISFPFFVVFQG